MLYKVYRVNPDGTRTCLNTLFPFTDAHAATECVQQLNDLAAKLHSGYEYFVSTARVGL